MDDLVVATLKEGRVIEATGFAPSSASPAANRTACSLGDPHVVVAIGQLLLEDVEPGTGVHRRGDFHDPRVAAALLDERLAEHRRVLRG